MKIKSFILACTLLAFVGSAYAQKGAVNSAKSDYDKYSQLKAVNTASLGVSNLNSAKTNIDKAVANEKTQNDPAAWAYRALIYADLALLDSVPAKSEPLITEAANSIKKAVELDKEGQNKENIENATRLLAQYTLNKGVKEFQGKQYAEAYSSFDKGLTYMPGDTTFAYYAGLSAINAKDYDKAIDKYNQLLKTNFSALDQVYMDLSRLYAAQKDTANAIRVAGEGAQKFPGNSELATQEIELSLLSGKQKEVIEKISAQAQKEPNKSIYPFYLGISYGALKDYAKAEEAYKKAIAIDPNYTDAYVNVGGMILNNGIELIKKAEKIPVNKQADYDAAMKKANAELDRALPYLQKATELAPQSGMALENLKTYYIAKRNQAKVTEIQKKIDALQ